MKTFRLSPVLSLALSWTLCAQASGRFETFIATLAADTPPATIRWRITLTYLPSFHPESQIVIWETSDADGGIALLRFTKPARQMIGGQGLPQTSGDIEKFKSAAGFTMKHLVADIPRLRGWYNELARQITSTATAWRRASESLRRGEASVQLDGTSYVLEIEVGENRFRASIMGSEVDEAPARGETPLVSSMRALRKQVIELASAN